MKIWLKTVRLVCQTMMPYITAFFMPRTEGDPPDVIPNSYVNFAFLGQFADTPRDTVYLQQNIRENSNEGVFGLLRVTEVCGGIGQRLDIRELLDSSVKLMEHPLEIQLSGTAKRIEKTVNSFY